MENRYRLEGDVAIIEVPYKNQIIDVTIDKEDIEKASSIQGRWILVRKTPKTDLFYFVCNKDKSIYLHKLIVGASKEDKVYFKDKNYTNLRKENLSINTFEVDDAFREKRKKAYQNMSPQGKANLLRGIKWNRYSKEWSDKLSNTKKGEQNSNTKLNAQLVREIREAYATRRFTQQALADYYQVGRTTIADIVNYRTWNEIGEDPNKEYRVYKENEVIELNLQETPIQWREFTNEDIWKDDFVLHVIDKSVEEYLFIQKIGKIKLYVEVRDKNKEFYHSFEVVFPEFLTPLHIHNYVIAHRKPVRYMSRHEIHRYMMIISTFLFGESYKKKTNTTNHL
jgi:predicted XRE-type DNA-binding protein